MSTPGLCAPAAFILRGLRDHPDLRLPEAIAAEAEMDVQDINDGWRLTDAARSGL
jgi:hypothetical protein